MRSKHIKGKMFRFQAVGKAWDKFINSNWRFHYNVYGFIMFLLKSVQLLTKIINSVTKSGIVHVQEVIQK